MKTAWIFPGGAARSVYTAGAIYALGKIKVVPPDIIIAASGSAPTIVCYITGQYETIPKVWLESLSTKKFVNFFRLWKIVNIDYLIDVVIRKNNPLDIEKLQTSGIEVYFPLTSSATGEIVYFSNKTELDIWEVLKASVSGPIVSNLFSLKGTKVGSEYFCDSTSASRFELHVQKAINEGATNIVVFDNWHRDDNPTNYFFW